MSQIQFFGTAPNIAEAAKRIGYSRQSLYTWKKRGCPAFLPEGTVDLSKIREWLNREGIGMDVEHGFGEGLAEGPDLTAPEAGTQWKGGRDYGFDLDTIQTQLFRFHDLLKEDGHDVAAEEFDKVWDQCSDILDKFEARMVELGLTEKLNAGTE